MKSDDKAKLYKIILSFLEESEKSTGTEDDKTFRKEAKAQIIERDKEYTELLSHFVKVTKIRNYLKEFFKWTFYAMIIISIMALVCMTKSLFNMYVKQANIQQVITSIPLLISSIVGFVSVIVTIPITITKYLFSTKEDEYITELILHTQDHDTSGREWTSSFKEFADAIENSEVGDASYAEKKMKEYQEMDEG